MGTALYIRMSEAIEPGLDLAARRDRFVSEHSRRVFAQIYHIVRNVADAQDLTQEAFIKALQALNSCCCGASIANTWKTGCVCFPQGSARP